VQQNAKRGEKEQSVDLPTQVRVKSERAPSINDGASSKAKRRDAGDDAIILRKKVEPQYACQAGKYGVAVEVLLARV